MRRVMFFLILPVMLMCGNDSADNPTGPEIKGKPATVTGCTSISYNTGCWRNEIIEKDVPVNTQSFVWIEGSKAPTSSWYFYANVTVVWKDDCIQNAYVDKQSSLCIPK